MMVEKRRRRNLEVLVQWKRPSRDDATWEDEAEIKMQYPKLRIGDKAIFEGEAIVTKQGDPSELDDPAEGGKLKADEYPCGSIEAPAG